MIATLKALSVSLDLGLLQADAGVKGEFENHGIALNPICRFVDELF